jgi:sigma-B regulation protein RsbU (phosphoserine phosphatase)
MMTEGRVIGAFNLESDHLGAFEPPDVKLLTTFGAQAAVAIERARLHEELMEKWRLEEEVRIARTIQERLFPRVVPVLPGFDLAGLNVPSRRVSGDLYDYFTVVPGHVGIMIADVAGKGVPAALVGATLRASLRTEIQNTYSIKTILSKINALLLESLEPTRFVTGVYGVLDVDSGRLTYSNAGHNPPLWLRPDDTVEWLWEGGTVLGAYPQASYAEGAIQLTKGDVVVLYTDGITEAQCPEGEEFGSQRLVDVVRRERGRSAEEICRELIREARLHEGIEQADDLTVLIIKAPG